MDPLPDPGSITVLDGGLATELMARGHDLSDRLWSARLLLTDPDAIEHAHLAYFRAGARVATTASYQASVEGFAAAGINRVDALRLIRSSVELAARARDRHRAETGSTERLLVAGSIGPYGAMLADGSEYRGDYAVSNTELADFHRPRLEALIEAGADLLAIETIPSVAEADVIVRLVGDLGASGWLSYSCRDGRTTSAGDPIEAAVALGDARAIIAAGINCTAPRHLPELLARAGAVRGAPLIAYPNGGDRWHPASRRWLAGAAGRFDPAIVATWTAFGATWLGGCCGTGPTEIRELADALS